MHSLDDIDISLCLSFETAGIIFNSVISSSQYFLSKFEIIKFENVNNESTVALAEGLKLTGDIAD